MRPALRAEFCGFRGLARKLSALLGPLSCGLITWATGRTFLVGLALLTGVHTRRGRRAALRAERVFAKAPP